MTEGMKKSSQSSSISTVTKIIVVNFLMPIFISNIKPKEIEEKLYLINYNVISTVINDEIIVSCSLIPRHIGMVDHVWA